MNRAIRLWPTDLLILVALARLGEDAYGVSIRHEVRKRTGRNISIAAVYAALERLEHHGYVAARMSDPLPERGGRSRKCFALRRAGALKLQQERETFTRLWTDLDLALSMYRR